jgi:lysozyme
MQQSKNILVIASIVLMILLANPADAASENLIMQLEEGNQPALSAYDDGYGNWTIGFGSTYNYDLGRPVRKGDKITIDQAYKYMRIEIQKITQDINDFVTVPLNGHELTALTSLGYNIGSIALEGSTLIKQLNAGLSRKQVADRFLDYTKARNKYTGRLEFSQGLYNRRVIERDLFVS